MVLPNGSNLYDRKSSADEKVFTYSGRVLSSDGNPIQGAVLDVWHSDDFGYYDLQKTNFRKASSHLGFRAKFVTDADGKWSFKTLPVKSYPLPTDGPAVSQISNNPGIVSSELKP